MLDGLEKLGKPARRCNQVKPLELADTGSKFHEIDYLGKKMVIQTKLECALKNVLLQTQKRLHFLNNSVVHCELEQSMH